MGTCAILALVQHWVGPLQSLGHVVGIQNSPHGGLHIAHAQQIQAAVAQQL